MVHPVKVRIARAGATGGASKIMSRRLYALGPIRHLLTDCPPSGILPYDRAKLKETGSSAQPSDRQAAKRRPMRSDPTKDIDEGVGSAPLVKVDTGDKNLSRECWSHKT